MKPITWTIAASILLFITGCSRRNDHADAESLKRFTLKGNFTGFEDSTWLYARDQSGKLNDSVMLLQGSMIFKGVLPDSAKAMQILLTTKNNSAYKFIWVEHCEMTIKADAKNMRAAIINGSSTQAESDSLDKTMAHLDKRIDSVMVITRSPDYDPAQTKTMNEICTRTFDERSRLSQEFVRTHPASLVSLNILSIMTTSWGKDVSRELYDILTSENQQSADGKKIRRYLDFNKNPQVGDMFADFAEPDRNNNMVKLSSLQGKLVLLEFWASWCGPCRMENPNLVKTYQKFKDKGFDIFAVSLDEQKDAWLNAINKDGLVWHHVSDLKGADGTGSLIYSVTAIPENILIDQQGKIVARNLRGDALNSKIAEMLK